MRTLIYKSGFLRYFSSLLEYCQTGKRKRAYLSVFAVWVFIAFFSTQYTFSWVGAIMLGCIGVYLSGLRNAKPNVVSLSPVSPARRTVYTLFSPVLYFVLAVAGMIVIRVLFLLIETTYGLLIGIDVSELWKFAFQFNPYDEMGLYGILFGIIFQVACYSAGIFLTYIKKGGFKALFIFLFCLAIYLCLQFMSLPYSLTLEKGIRFIGFFVGMPFYRICYEYMQYPWLAVTLCGIATLAFLAVTVWFAFKRDKGKDY